MTDVNRRDALKSLAALAGATIVPVSSREATDVTLIILRPAKECLLSNDECARLVADWTSACDGTSLAGIKTVILRNDIEVEFVRKRP